MIGNDVVDLSDPEAQPGALHPRFDRRVCAASELARLAASDDPHRLRWRLWAAKEAAYKAARKVDAGLVFSPAKLVVDLDARRVCCGNRLFALRWEESDEWIHAIADDGTEIVADDRVMWSAPLRGARRCEAPPRRGSASPCRAERGAPIEDTLRGAVGVVDSGPVDPQSTRASIFVRELACQAVAEAVCVDVDHIAIVAHGRIPRIQVRGLPTPVDLSLSHHGRFAAYAFNLAGVA